MIENLITSTLLFIPDPYFGTPNLTLKFQVETGEFEIDDSGNVISEVEIITVLASVKHETEANNTEYLGAIGVDEMLLTGRLINPKLMPVSIQASLERGCEAELKDLASNQILKGDFRFVPVSQHRFPQVTQKFGQNIRGFLKVGARV